MIASAIIGIWFARYIGVSEFGIWSYSLSILALGLPFVNLGINNILLTELSKGSQTDEQIQTYMMNAIALKVISSVIFVSSVILYCFLATEDTITKIVLLILSFQSFFQAADVFDVYYQSRTESKNTVKIKFISFSLVSVIKIIALITKCSLELFALIALLETVVATVIILIYYVKYSQKKLPKYNIKFSIIKSLLLRGWPFLIAELLIVFYTRLDQIMIKNMIGEEELARYSAAVRLSEIWYFIPVAVCVSVYPTLVKLKESDGLQFNNGVQKLFNILAFISISVAIVTTFISDYVALFLYGEAYRGTGAILAIHIWTGVAVFLGVGSGYWLILNGLQKYSLLQTISGALVNIILNFVLIPKYLGVGAAISTLIAQTVATIVATTLVSKTRPIFTLQMKAILNIFRPAVKNYF